MKVVLDTNVLGSALIEGEPSRAAALRLLEALDDGGHEVFLSTIVIAELGVAFFQAGATFQWASFLATARLGRRYRIVALDMDLAESAARIRATLRIKLADAVVAATAISVSADLLVSDDTDLRKASSVVAVRSLRRALGFLRAA